MPDIPFICYIGTVLLIGLGAYIVTKLVKSMLRH